MLTTQLIGSFFFHCLSCNIFCSINLLSESEVEISSDSDIEESSPKRPCQRGTSLPTFIPAPAPAPVVECTICFENLLGGGDNFSLPCAHVFHRQCIVQWVQTTPVCPVCRMDVPADFHGDQPAPAPAPVHYDLDDSESDSDWEDNHPAARWHLVPFTPGSSSESELSDSESSEESELNLDTGSDSEADYLPGPSPTSPQYSPTTPPHYPYSESDSETEPDYFPGPSPTSPQYDPMSPLHY